KWADESLRRALLDFTDGDGLARRDGWCPGRIGPPPPRELGWLKSGPAIHAGARLGRTLGRARQGGLTEAEIAELVRAQGDDFAAICRAADKLRREVNGNSVSYVVTRNINYTNICSFKCQFCAFSKGKMSENLRGRPYDLDLSEI